MYSSVSYILNHTHSKCYHSLVQLNMGGEGSSGDMAGKEQAWAVLAEVLDLLGTRAKVSLIPEPRAGVVSGTRPSGKAKGGSGK